jgi:phage gp29-like protein
VSEVEWDPDTWAPLRFHQRDQRRFLFDSDCNPRLITPENRQEGIQLPEKKFIVHRFGAKDGNPYGLGLGTRLFWPTLFKRQGMGFWSVFAEKFGGPTVLAKYPEFMEQAKQDALL